MSTAEEKKPETEMPVDKPEQKGELKLNHPKPFSGKREDLKKFLQDVKLYLHVNDKIYDHHAKKISFALSFMNEGDAASWKEQLLEEVMAKEPFDLGTWDVFEKNLTNAFQPYDAPGDALEEMKNSQNGKRFDRGTQRQVQNDSNQVRIGRDIPSCNRLLSRDS